MKKIALLPIAALVMATAPLGASAACDAVIAAVHKVYQVPTHMYMTETTGRGRSYETIYLNGAVYIKSKGAWQKSSVTVQDLQNGKETAVKPGDTCTQVRDEAVNGEAATLYKAHHQTPDDTVDTQMWISKSRGLPLKQINDIDVGSGPGGKSHSEIRYEYTNVTAPAVSEPRRK